MAIGSSLVFLPILLLALLVPQFPKAAALVMDNVNAAVSVSGVISSLEGNHVSVRVSLSITGTVAFKTKWLDDVDVGLYPSVGVSSAVSLTTAMDLLTANLSIFAVGKYAVVLTNRTDNTSLVLDQICTATNYSFPINITDSSLPTFPLLTPFNITSSLVRSANIRPYASAS